MESKTIRTGERGKKHMPYSEVCMHMQVAGKVMEFVAVSTRSVQLYREDGTMFSFPITNGEAGLFPDGDHFYYYPDDSKSPESPSLVSER